MSSIAGRIDTEEETLSGWKKVASEFLASSRASPPLHVASEDWSSAENTALVEYVLFYGDPHVWPNYSSKEKERK